MTWEHSVTHTSLSKLCSHLRLGFQQMSNTDATFCSVSRARLCMCPRPARCGGPTATASCPCRQLPGWPHPATKPRTAPSRCAPVSKKRCRQCSCCADVLLGNQTTNLSEAAEARTLVFKALLQANLSRMPFPGIETPHHTNRHMHDKHVPTASLRDQHLAAPVWDLAS